MTEREEIEKLKARIRAAQLRLDGGNDCFDSLEEVVDATVKWMSQIRGKLQRIDQLEKALVESAIPYEALLADPESRKWIAPEIWVDIEFNIKRVHTLLLEDKK